MAFSKLLNTPRRPKQSAGGGEDYQRRRAAPAPRTVWTSKVAARPPPSRDAPPPRTPAAHSRPPSRRFRPPHPTPRRARGLPAAAALVVGQSGPGDATVRQEAVARATHPLPHRPPDRGPAQRRCAPAPASCPHPSRLRPPGRLPSAGAPGSGAPRARGRPARLTYQE